MAKKWAKAFYNSDAWKATRYAVLLRDGFTCERCGARAEEVHHEIALTQDNVHDPKIALNPTLLHSLCHDCHTSITQHAEDCDADFYFDADGLLTPRVPIE